MYKQEAEYIWLLWIHKIVTTFFRNIKNCSQFYKNRIQYKQSGKNPDLECENVYSMLEISDLIILN